MNLSGKHANKILKASKKLRETVKNTVIKGNIYDAEAYTDHGGIKSYIPTNFVEFSGIKMEYYYFIMDPGKTVSNHVHPHEDELYFVLDGEGVFGLNGKTFSLKRGDVHHILAGQWHSLDTTKSTRKLEIFIVVAPAIPYPTREDRCVCFREEDWKKMGYGK